MHQSSALHQKHAQHLDKVTVNREPKGVWTR